MTAFMPNLYAAFNADATVNERVAGRIYMGRAPDDSAAPFIVWQLISNIPGLQLSGRPTYDAQLLQVDAYSMHQAGARNLAFAVRDVLEQMTYVTRGPEDVGQEATTSLFRWTMDADFIWNRHA